MWAALGGGLPHAPAGAAEVAQAAGNGYVQAQALFHERKYREAIALLDTYIASNPSDAKAVVLRGDCRADLGENQAALGDYNAALKIAPDYQYGYVTRCETRLVLEDLPGALADCNIAIRLNAGDGLAFEDRADVYFQQQANALALTDYDRAVTLGRSQPYVFAARCDTERLLGKTDAAAADCERALMLDPASRRGLWARARLALVTGRYLDGTVDFGTYIALNPKASDTAYYFRGLAYNRLQRYADALADLQIYVTRIPADADGYKERAVARFGNGDRAGALADLAVAATGYQKSADTDGTKKVAAMIAAIQAGQKPAP